MNNILVTGATGFVGRHLVEHLCKNNYSATALVRSTSNIDKFTHILDNSSIVKYDGDINSLAQELLNRRIDSVVHLASLYIAEHQANDIDPLIDSNIRFGAHLLESMKVAGVNTLLNFGTSWQNYHSNAYNPANLYAATKQAFEDLIKYYVNASNFRCITLRLFDTYGENDERKKLIQLLIETALSETTLDMSPGKQKINLCHIDDICHAISIAITELNHMAPGSAKIYGTSANETVSLQQLVQLVEQIVGKPLKINWGARSYRQREVMEPHTFYDSLPGWKPTISLKDGVTKVFGNYSKREY